MAQPPKGAKTGDMRIDPSLVRDLAQLLTDNELTEIEVEDGDRRIKVKREPAAVIAGAIASAPAAAPALSAPPMHAKEDIGEPAEEEVAGTSIKSPMVGTVFLAGEPGAPPFVSVGTLVSEGDTLLIIEAMKVMNPITAPKGGTVKEVLVQNAQPVEFDQPLVIIE